MVDAANAELLGHNFPFRDVLPSYSILNVLYCPFSEPTPIWANCKSFLAASCRRAPRVRALSCQWFEGIGFLYLLLSQ
jgi:hypothetical protein